MRALITIGMVALLVVGRLTAAAPGTFAPAGPATPAVPVRPAITDLPATHAAPALVATQAVPAAAATTNQLEQNIELGYRALQSGQTNAALSLFKSVLTREPKNKRARFGLATALIQTDQYKEAIALLEPLVAEYPTDYFLRNNLAWVLATARDPAIRNGQRAVQLSQEALLYAPNDSHVWSTLAEAYFLCGHYDKALRSAQQALNLSREGGMDPQLIKDYERQVERCRKAAEAMSILE